MPKKPKSIRFAIISAQIVLLGLLGFFVLRHIPTAKAADNNFTDGITVDSTLDTPDSNIGDGICDDGDGNCTLRAAIEEANSDPDASTIDFAITGTGLHTLTPATPLPTIATELTIDGYSQSGSQANTATSPDPFNGTLTIEIDGANIPRNNSIDLGSCISVLDADNVTIKGLVIHSCGNDGIHVERSNYAKIQGNYIGVDPTGLQDKGNGRDYTTASIGDGIFMNASNNVLIGGSQPAERNIIAGNQAGDIFWGNEGNNANPSENNTVQGNYIGVGADGQTPLPAGYAWGLGNAILFGNSHNDLIGGDQSGEGNVIGSSYEYGVAFRDASSGTIIQGNYIGTDYTGTQTMPHSYGSGNAAAGIHVGAVSQLYPDADPYDVLIGGNTAGARNIISGNHHTGGGNIAGVSINDGAYNVTVQNNYIGVDSSGTNALSNDFGVLMDTTGGIQDTHNNIIGGTGANEGNLISGNVYDGVAIIGNGAYNNSILGNIITNNGDLGIDLGDDGGTANDPGDADSGPNTLLNRPVITEATETGGNTEVHYILDVPSGDYRVEFFGNPFTTLNISDGTSFIGSQNVTSTGSGAQNFSITLSGTGHGSITSTATQINNATPSGFGNTSEFSLSSPSLVSSTRITKVLNNPEDVAANANLDYTITITNEGPSDLDLTQFDGSGPNPFVNGLFVDILPPELSFNSVDGSDVNCLNAGPGTASLTPFLGNHNDYGLVLCSYAGVATTLGSGESLNIIIHTTVADTTNLDFTNFVLGAVNDTDDDYSKINNSLGSPDFIDYLTENNVDNLAFASSTQEEIGPDSPAVNTAPTLPSVGQTMALIFAVLLATGASWLTYKRYKH